MRLHNDFFYTIGLDVGTNSVGWAVVETEPNTKLPVRLIDTGVRLFEAAEVPKTGDSLNLERRIARGTRRRIRRRVLRLTDLKELFLKRNLLQSLDDLNSSDSPWELRVKALDEVITPTQLCIALLHVAKRRGFKSNRKKASDDEGGNYKKYISDNQQLMKEKGYRTVGEMILKDKRFNNHKRNKDNDYICMVSRSDLQSEAELILNTQKQLLNRHITDDFIQEVIKIAFRQRPTLQGDALLRMVGKCSLESEEYRAPTHSYSFEEFRFWQEVGKIKIVDTKNDYAERYLTLEQKKELLNLSLNTTKLSYKKIRSALKLAHFEIFSNVTYLQTEEGKIGSYEGKTYLLSFKGYHSIRTALKNLPKTQLNKILASHGLLDEVAFVLTVYKTDDDIKSHLSKINGLTKMAIDSLLTVTSFSKFGHLSLKAITQLLPYLRKGISYTESLEKAGYKLKSHSKHLSKLPSNPEHFCDITNPVVLRSVSQTRKIINAIIDKYGSPGFINIELARDLQRSYKDRKKIEKNNLENKRSNQLIKEEVARLGIENPSGKDIIKYRLWKEQNEKCLYSQKYIPLDSLFAPNFTQIDHAVPISRSLDDSYFNKVLVLTSENQNKKNQTPFEFFGNSSDSPKWVEYEAYVQSLNIHTKKKQLLLKKSVPDDEKMLIDSFTDRQLNDTRYASRFLKNFIEHNLQFKESKHKQKVGVFTGQFTAFLRKVHGLNKNRSNARHHALDAIMVSVSNAAMAQKVVAFSKNKTLYETNSIKNFSKRYPEPWKDFRTDVLNRVFSDNVTESLEKNEALCSLYQDVKDIIKPIFVSRMPKRKVTGKAHNATIYSTKIIDKNSLLIRKSIHELKANELGLIYGDELVKKAISDRLAEFNGDTHKAFSKPIYKPKKNGTKGNVIKKVTIRTKKPNGLLFKQKKFFAENSSIVRTDIFMKDGKYFLVPIYVSDTLKHTPPQRAIIAHKDKSDWQLIDGSYTFLFSLFKNDLIEVCKKGEQKLVYFEGVHSGSGQINYISHDGENRMPIGAKTLDSFKKFQVSVLGEYYKINREKRRGF